MRWRYLVVPIIFSLLLVTLACSDYRPGQRPPWAADSNLFMLGDDEAEPQPAPVVSARYALVLIEDVRCGSSDEDAYIVSISWGASLDNATSLTVEYEVVNGPVNGEEPGMIDGQVAFELTDSFESGSSEIKIAKEEVAGVGDVILVRLIVSSSTEGEFKSPVDDYVVNEICPEN